MALSLFRAGLEAVDAKACTARALDELRAAGAVLDGCTVFAFGKAATAMAQVAVATCSPRDGVVISHDGAHVEGLRAHQGGHPIPLTAAPALGQEVADMAAALGDGDVALVLVSGGASAMLELPREGVPMATLRGVTESLLRSGAPIEEMNAVRTAMSQLKGGGLSERIYPAKVYNVVLSDVPGRPVSVVASGPTIPSAPSEELEVILRKHRAWQRIPDTVREIILTPREPRREDHITTVVAGDNRTARDAMVRHARERGLHVLEYPGFVSGEAKLAGAIFVRACLRQPADVIIGGGETTVKVTGTGRGGRNQEFVLGGASILGDGLLLSAGTDGIDGASTAAGALCDAEVLRTAHDHGALPDDALERNDSEAFFAAGGGRIETGPTGTNVADVCLFLK